MTHHIHRFVRKRKLFVVAGTVIRQEGFRQWLNIAPALPQRRNVQNGYLEAVIEIRPECASGHLPAEILVGGRDDAHIDLAGFRGSHAHDLEILQNAQKP